ncbi:hypothetical protein C8R44DRAFT_771779 [Mycena epipterygia]|nr:hypothetical protein C8R44DRAFT_771779 [Mycena epipterygia]
MRPLMNDGGAIINISSRIGSMGTHQLGVAGETKWLGDSRGVYMPGAVQGWNSTKLNNYSGPMSPAEGCKIIVKTALEKEGRTAVFFNKDGDLKW